MNLHSPRRALIALTLMVFATGMLSGPGPSSQASIMDIINDLFAKFQTLIGRSPEEQQVQLKSMKADYHRTATEAGWLEVKLPPQVTASGEPVRGGSTPVGTTDVPVVHACATPANSCIARQEGGPCRRQSKPQRAGDGCLLEPCAVICDVPMNLNCPVVQCPAANVPFGCTLESTRRQQSGCPMNPCGTVVCPDTDSPLLACTAGGANVRTSHFPPFISQGGRWIAYTMNTGILYDQETKETVSIGKTIVDMGPRNADGGVSVLISDNDGKQHLFDTVSRKYNTLSVRSVHSVVRIGGEKGRYLFMLENESKTLFIADRIQQFIKRIDRVDANRIAGTLGFSVQGDTMRVGYVSVAGQSCSWTLASSSPTCYGTATVGPLFASADNLVEKVLKPKLPAEVARYYWPGYRRGTTSDDGKSVHYAFTVYKKILHDVREPVADQVNVYVATLPNGGRLADAELMLVSPTDCDAQTDIPELPHENDSSPLSIPLECPIVDCAVPRLLPGCVLEETVNSNGCRICPKVVCNTAP